MYSTPPQIEKERKKGGNEGREEGGRRREGKQNKTGQPAGRLGGPSPGSAPAGPIGSEAGADTHPLTRVTCTHGHRCTALRATHARGRLGARERVTSLRRFTDQACHSDLWVHGDTYLQSEGGEGRRVAGQAAMQGPEDLPGDPLPPRAQGTGPGATAALSRALRPRSPRMSRWGGCRCEVNALLLTLGVGCAEAWGVPGTFLLEMCSVLPTAPCSPLPTARGLVP